MTCDQGPDAAGPAPPLGGVSRWVDVDGAVHYLDFGGPADGPVIVCVHGLGGGGVNWSAIAPLLTDRFRLLAPDLAGHGLTRAAGRGTDVVANRVLLHHFVESVPGAPVILMGNSMGGMISLLEASAAPDAVAGLILLDPALPFVPVRPDPVVTALFALQAMPGLNRILAGRRRDNSPEASVTEVLALCCADPSRVSADVIAEHVAVVRQRAGFAEAGHEFTVAMRSVLATAGYVHGRAYRRGIRTIRCPVLLVHGSRDRLVPVGAARVTARANPSWSLVVLDGVGHVPQLEAPTETAEAITHWLDSAGRPAAEIGLDTGGGHVR